MTDRLAAAVAELVAALREEVAPAVLDAPDRLLSVHDACAALGIGRSALYGVVGRGELRSFKIGRRRLIPADSLAEFSRAQP